MKRISERNESLLLRSRRKPRPAARRDDRREPAPNRRPARRAGGAGGAPAGLPGQLPRVVGADLTLRQRAAGAGSEEGRPGRHLVSQPLRVDGRPVRHRPDGRDPRQHQPRLQDLRAGVRAQAVGSQLPDPGQGLPNQRLRLHAGRGARPLSGAARGRRPAGGSGGGRA